MVDRPSGGAGRPQPARERGLADGLRGLLGEREEDRQLGPVVEVAGDEAERVGVEDGAELVVGEAQAPLEDGCGRTAQNSWFSPPKTSDTESSVKIRRIESVRRSAQESTRMLSGAPGRRGIVSVTTICSKPALARFS